MTNNHSPKPVNVNNVTIPLVTIVSLLSFVMWATFEFAKDRQALKDELKHEFTTELKVQREIIEQVKDVIFSIKERQKMYLENIWSKRDHMIWCYEVQKKNSGFTCPDYNSWKQNGLLGNYEKFGMNSDSQRKLQKENETVNQWKQEENAEVPLTLAPTTKMFQPQSSDQ